MYSNRLRNMNDLYVEETKTPERCKREITFFDGENTFCKFVYHI